MRIVSLLSSATEIVCELGLADWLVGVSSDADWPSEVVKDLPVLDAVAFDPSRMTSREIDAAASGGGHQGASLYHVDADLLRRLQPELILTQEICEVCAVSRRDVDFATSTLGYVPRIVSLNAVTLEQVLEDIGLVASACGVRERAVDTVRALRARLEHVGRRSAGLARPRVFCMEWLDPPYSAGHWIPEMVELAGARDELGTRAGPSREIGWNEVVNYDPEVLVLMPCSLSLDRVASEFDLLRNLAGWSELACVKSGQVYAGHTDLFSRSGPRLVDGTEVLARMVHPAVFSEPLAHGQALKIAPDGSTLRPFT